MSSRSLRIKLQGGPVLHLQEWGIGRDVCLLIHGFGEGGYVWNEFAPALAQHYRTFAIDLRGHGDSEWDPNADYDIRTHVFDVIQIIKTIGCDRISLVGHSMGADIAIRVALETRELISGVVIVDFGPRLNPAGTEQIRTAFRTGNQIYESVSDYVQWLAAQRPLVEPDLLRKMAACALARCADGTFRRKTDPSMLSCVNGKADPALVESTLWTLLRKMSFPVLLVRGAGSAVLDRDIANRMMEALPNGRFVSVRCAGHDVMSDNPAAFLHSALPFLLELQARSELDTR
jgi:pimeloyl-ACP methyl ester carboxylesterase